MPGQPPFIADLLRRLAPQVKAKLYLEPEQQRTGYLQFRNGRRCFFRDNRFDLNTLGAVNIARDKGFCASMLRHFGYNVPEELSFWTLRTFPGAPNQRTIHDALAFARAVGYPVYIKPNNRSQGLAVSRAENSAQLRQAARRVFAVADVALVQRAYAGADYRLVVLGGQLISAYQRIPLEVQGDGKSTIEQLLERRQAEYLKRERDTTLRITPELKQRLRRLGLTLRTRLRKGQRLQLADIANLSVGGEAREVLGETHDYYRELVRRIAADLNLHFCGIDLIARNVRRPDPQHVILEVNASPGLDNYASHDPAQQSADVDALYLKVLRYIERRRR